MMQQHVMVEVAPSELAAVGRRPLSPPEPVLDLARRDASEVEIRRQAGGTVGAERLAALGILAHRAGEE
jgi:hypothetical protein